MKNILSEEINHHEQESTECKKKTPHYTLSPLRPLDQKLLHTGYKIGTLEILKEIQDSSTTKKQKAMKNDQGR